MRRNCFDSTLGCWLVLAICIPCPELFAQLNVIQGAVRLEGRGLSEVMVSDGFRVVSSDANGDYRIDLPPDAPPPPDVFIVRPAGTRCVGRFWKVTSKDAEGAMGADFDLVRDERSGQDDFSFLVISDLHLRWGPLPSLGRVRPAPAFVACLGDLVNNEPNGMGDPRPLVSYGNVISQHLWMPVFTAFGNHDWSKAPEGSEDQSLVYRLNIAPRRYAFECGTRLFVVYDTETPRVSGKAADKAQREWVEAVVAGSQSTGPIIVLQHIPPPDEQVAWLAQLGRPVQAIFSGHHHSNHLKRPHGILEVNTPPFYMGGIDFSPAGFRVVTIEGDRMQMAFHSINLQKHLRVVAPTGAVTVQDGSVDTVVTAVDAYVPVTGVRAGLEGGGTPVELKREGRWTWRGAVAVPEGVEAGSVNVSVADHENETWPSRVEAFQVAPAPAGIATATPWTQFRRGGKGHSSTPDLVRPPLRLAWTWCSGGEIDFGSPVTDGKHVYIGIRDDDNKGMQGVAALDARSGEQAWRFKTEASIRHTVLVSSDRVFAVGFNGQAVALDAQTGSKVWERHLSLAWGSFYSGVVTDGRRVYLRSRTGAFALDGKDGSVLWSVEVPGGWNQSYATPVFDGDRVFVGTSQIDATSGELLHKGESAVISSSITSHGIALGSQMFDYEKLQPQWTAPIHGRRWGSASTAILKDRIYTTGSDSGHKKAGGFYAFDAGSGEIAWFRGFEGCILWRDGYRSYSGGSGSSSPAISGGRIIYVGADDGHLRALNVEDGEELWKYDLGSPVASSPAVSGNAVFAAALDGNVYGFASMADEAEER